MHLACFGVSERIKYIKSLPGCEALAGRQNIPCCLLQGTLQYAGEVEMANLAINGGEKTVPDGILTPWPIITDEDKKMVMECMESGIFTGPYGPQVRGAETEFAEYLGVKHVLMVNSGTAALHMAVAVAGIGPGDEVIVPSFTFLATALAVLHNNAVPVFVDIEPRAFMLDPSKIEGRITSRTKAIIPVHLHGQCADMDAINEIAKKHNLIVIEDTAQAHGAKYKGKLAGTLGDMSIFSVQASKNLASGEGGFFVTNNDEMANFANRMRLFGQDASFEDEKFIDLNWPIDRFRGFESVIMGYQYMTGELPAAMTRSQLKSLDEKNANSRANGEYLSDLIKDTPGLEPPFVPEYNETVYHKFRIRLDPKAAGIDVPSVEFRDKVLKAIQVEGVESCLWEVLPLPLQYMFKNHVGYGSKCPWACKLRDEPAPETAPEDYEKAKMLLDNSLVIGSHSFPMIAQKREVMDHYAAAIKKVFDNLDELFE